MNNHIPVLLDSVIEYLRPQDGKVYFDGTFGGGGYSNKILSTANCRIIATDRDQNVQPFANVTKQNYPNRFDFCNAKFSEIQAVLKHFNISKVDAIILDLGISNFQISNAERGFSFKQTGPLDMTMGQCSTNALEILHQYSEKELADIIYELGEERFSRRIAKNIKLNLKNIYTTTDLAQVIHKCVRNNGKIDSATKTFQALRIFVNDELKELQKILTTSLSLLNPSGKIIVVSFHSLEDRIVKLFFKNIAHEYPEKYKIDTKKPITPTKEEIDANPKSRSAKMRCLTVMES